MSYAGALCFSLYVTPLYAANAVDLGVLGLRSRAGVFVTDATLTCTVTDVATGVMLATVFLNYLGAGVALRGYADGNYLGSLPGSIGLVAGRAYKLEFAASNYGLSVDAYRTAQARQD
ncbi:MAG TPA: hypothetical protein VMV10_08695 [Pirellulales bacterium]|nr:hypothetical protein [Pirellulales bacterium]